MITKKEFNAIISKERSLFKRKYKNETRKNVVFRTNYFKTYETYIEANKESILDKETFDKIKSYPSSYVSHRYMAYEDLVDRKQIKDKEYESLIAYIRKIKIFE